MFQKYMHLERLGTSEVEGIEVGTTYVFPKLDGTNAQVWAEGGTVFGGSRNRKLSLDNDNAGFYNWLLTQNNHKEFLNKHPHLTLYGEWLVPHTLKTYQDEAWRRFYIFDVLNRNTGNLLPYDEYRELVMEFDLDYLAPISIHKNASVEDYLKALDKNVFLIKDGQGIGEGIVVKNYLWENKFGRAVWAKLISNTFKMNHHATMGAPMIGSDIVELKIVEEYVTQHLIDKVYAKIVADNDGWSKAYIPRLLGEVYYDLLKEETWDFVKKFKQPKVDFKLLQSLTTQQIKLLKQEAF